MKNEIYTDGSIWPNPGGVGGWAFVKVCKNEKCEEIHEVVSGGEDQTTNNRMELRAIIEAIRMNDNVVIYSDSQYCINSINLWMKRWVKEGQSDRANNDMFCEISDLLVGKNIEFKWVRGHNGNKYNEIADKAAGEARAILEEELIEKSFLAQ